MLKENWRLISRIQRISDLFIVTCAFLLAYHSRPALLYWNELFGLEIPFIGEELAPIKDYIFVLLVALLSYAYLLGWSGAYHSMRLADLPKLMSRTFGASLLVFLVLAALTFMLKMDFSRSFIIVFCSLSALFLTAERYLTLGLLRYWRRRGRNFRNVLICGVNSPALELAQEITRRPELGLGVKAFVRLCPTEHSSSDALNQGGNQALKRAPVIDSVEEVQAFIQEQAIDEVIFTDIVPVMEQVRLLVNFASDLGVRITFVGDLFSVGLVRSAVRYFGSIPLIHYQTPPGDDWGHLIKRLLDVTLASLGLIVLSPFILLIGALIKFTSKGPVLFNQKRVGLNGRLFTLYKFRSMRVGSEELSPDLIKLNQVRGPAFKLKKDPRVTRFGRFIRRHSLDELPQLWNVIRGDMSLVGPRPPIPGEVSMYERRDRRRLSMRPGLTGAWQVSGRSNIEDFESWVKLDLEYIDNWSIWYDLKLILRTIPTVIFGRGAY